MDQRKECRIAMELSVRIWGMDRNRRPFAEMVRAGNLSSTGAVLLGVRSKIHAGELLDVQHGAQRAQFRVVWTRAGEAGIQALPFEPSIWGIDAPKRMAAMGTG